MDDTELANRIVKVNHAGEHGAVNIYRGQILVCRWRAPLLVPELQEFLSHEQRHRETFRMELARRKHRRCRSYHFCGFGGLLLGLFTGLCGPQAVAATTVAVERVVLDHLEQQMALLSGVDKEAFDAVASIVKEEKAHHDAARDKALTTGLWFRLLSPVVSISTEIVIWLGMKL